MLSRLWCKVCGDEWKFDEGRKADFGVRNNGLMKLKSRFSDRHQNRLDEPCGERDQMATKMAQASSNCGVSGFWLHVGKWKEERPRDLLIKITPLFEHLKCEACSLFR